MRAVTQAVKGRGACKHPDGSARFLNSTLSTFTDDLAAHVLGSGCGRETIGLLPLPGAGYEDVEESIPSGEKLAVDWTLCKGHGLCAGIIPELIRMGPDGYPAFADAEIPTHLRGRAQRAVRRCPELALRIEQTRSERPSVPGTQRKALGSGRG